MRAAVLAAAGLFGLTINAAAVDAAPPDPTTGAADWLFSGGLVYTVDPTRPHAEAVAARGDTIVYVGDRAGAIVTYGADIPGLDLPEIAPLIQIEAAVTRKRPGFPDDLPLVPRRRTLLAHRRREKTTCGREKYPRQGSNL